MRIAFRTEGGIAAFPGLAGPVTIHCDALPPAEGARLRALVERANFFALPEKARPEAGVADARSYTIEVDDGAQCRTVTIQEPIADPAVRALVAALRERVAAARRGR
ncbi:MAG: protealysin inhibitor emfourin [Rudaea sp.]